MLLHLVLMDGSQLSFSWPQMTDELLNDMHLRTHRSGGGLLWPFKTIDTSQIENLHEERRALRGQYSSGSERGGDEIGGKVNEGGNREVPH